jgi:hypothetical protein
LLTVQSSDEVDLETLLPDVSIAAAHFLMYRSDEAAIARPPRRARRRAKFPEHSPSA